MERREDSCGGSLPTSDPGSVQLSIIDQSGGEINEKGVLHVPQWASMGPDSCWQAAEGRARGHGGTTFARSNQRWFSNP